MLTWSETAVSVHFAAPPKAQLIAFLILVEKLLALHGRVSDHLPIYSCISTLSQALNGICPLCLDCLNMEADRGLAGPKHDVLLLG